MLVRCTESRWRNLRGFLRLTASRSRTTSASPSPSPDRRLPKIDDFPVSRFRFNWCSFYQMYSLNCDRRVQIGLFLSVLLLVLQARPRDVLRRPAAVQDTDAAREIRSQIGTWSGRNPGVAAVAARVGVPVVPVALHKADDDLAGGGRKWSTYWPCCLAEGKMHDNPRIKWQKVYDNPR